MLPNVRFCWVVSLVIVPVKMLLQQVVDLKLRGNYIWEHWNTTSCPL